MTNDDIPFTDAEIAALASGNNTDKAKRVVPAAERGDASVSGTVLSNTVPPNTTLLHHGIDSLYLSYKGSLKERYAAKLQRLKEEACVRDYTQCYAQLYLLGEIFKVHDKGKGNFKYVISNDDFYIQLSERSALSTMPFAMVQIRSEYLSQVPAETAVEKLNSIIRELGIVSGEAKVSRIDLFCDVITDIDVPQFTEAHFITRALKCTRYSERKQFSGVTFGMGSETAFRLYNKTLEIKNTGKFYCYEIWGQAGWKKGKKVWRFEFEIKREALAHYGLSSFREVYQKKDYIWNYLTCQWLRLAVPNSNESHRDRWETHALWEFIQGISSHDNLLPRLSKPVTSYEKRRVTIVRYYKIALTDLMASTGEDDMEEAHAELLVAFQASYLMPETGSTSSQDNQLPERRRVKDCLTDIRQTVAKKRREFGTMFNSASTSSDDSHDHV